MPDEVAVVGVDNDETLCEVCNPPLSSVQAGHQVVGYKAAALLERSRFTVCRWPGLAPIMRWRW